MCKGALLGQELLQCQSSVLGVWPSAAGCCHNQSSPLCHENAVLIFLMCGGEILKATRPQTLKTGDITWLSSAWTVFWLSGLGFELQEFLRAF